MIHLQILNPKAETQARVARVRPALTTPTWEIGLELAEPGNIWGLDFSPQAFHWPADLPKLPIPAGASARAPTESTLATTEREPGAVEYGAEIPTGFLAGNRGMAAGFRQMGDEPLKVLLVEDDADVSRLLQTMLARVKSTRFDLESADRLSTGLERLAAGDINVILLDLTLPDSRGLDTLARARAHAPEAPIIVLTGLDDEALAIEAIREGAQDYLVKGQVDSNMLVRSMYYAIERHRMQAALRSLSLIDDLTGLCNRRGFLTLAEQHLKLVHRLERKAVLVLTDLDGLKGINDTFGHREGDRALIETAEVLRETFRESDILGRLGGDEFAALPIDASEESVEFLSTRVQEKVKARNAQDGRRYTLSLSVGAVLFETKQPYSIDELMAQADASMYEHKRTKRIARLEQDERPTTE